LPSHHPAETAETAREIETEEVGATNPTTAEEVAQEVPSLGIPRHTVVTAVLTPRAAEEGEVVEEEVVETEVESGRGIEVQVRTPSPVSGDLLTGVDAGRARPKDYERERDRGGRHKSTSRDRDRHGGGRMDRRRSRSRSRGRGAYRKEHDRRTRSRSAARKGEAPAPVEQDTVMVGNDDDEEGQMAAMLGFSGFGTTKQRKVKGNNVGAVAKNQVTEYRQYM
jgi:hypothetical protein